MTTNPRTLRQQERAGRQQMANQYQVERDERHRMASAPVQLAPEPPPPRRRRWRAGFHTIMFGGAAALALVATALRCAGVSGWPVACVTAFAAPFVALVIANRGWDRTGQAEAGAVTAAAGGWVTAVTVAGWFPDAGTYHHPHLPGFVPVLALICVPLGLGHLGERRWEAREAGRKNRPAGQESSPDASVETTPVAPVSRTSAYPGTAPVTRTEPHPAPSPRPVHVDDELAARIAVESGIDSVNEVRAIWAHLLRCKSITAREAGDLIAALPGFATSNPDAKDHKSTGQRRLAKMEAAGWLKGKARPVTSGSRSRAVRGPSAG